MTTVIDDFIKELDTISLDTSSIPLVAEGQPSINFTSVARRAKLLDIDMQEVTRMAVAMADVDGVGVDNVSESHYLHALVAIDRSRRGPETEDSEIVKSIVAVLEEDHEGEEEFAEEG